jgi:hypothetical protein
MNIALLVEKSCRSRSLAHVAERQRKAFLLGG